MKPGRAHEVRLIGGLWKRSKLPVADRPGLRPTPDRVRETLFNWLGQDLTGWRCLDAFAGSGALGLEAASRGASSVTLLEQDPALARGLRATVQRLGAAPGQVEVQAADDAHLARGAQGALRSGLCGRWLTCHPAPRPPRSPWCPVAACARTRP